MAQAKMAARAFAVVSVLCFIAALVPALSGGRLNVVFLACGVVFLIVAAGARRKSPPGT